MLIDVHVGCVRTLRKYAIIYMQVGPALSKKGQSNFLDHLKSYGNHTPISHECVNLPTEFEIR